MDGQSKRAQEEGERLNKVLQGAADVLDTGLANAAGRVSSDAVTVRTTYLAVGSLPLLTFCVSRVPVVCKGPDAAAWVCEHRAEGHRVVILSSRRFWSSVRSR